MFLSKGIRLPTNSSQWTNLNEGSQKFNINFTATEETNTLLYDKDLKIEMGWKVSKINILKRLSTDTNRLLSATDQTETGFLTREELVG